ncbi:MAG: hypothetical protein ACOCRX_06290 [Candidatus Woesearchaeota archaeon]
MDKEKEIENSTIDDEMVFFVKMRDKKGNMKRGLFSFPESRKNEAKQRIIEYCEREMIENIEMELFYKKELDIDEKII